MNVKDKQRTIIEFLLLEGCAGEEIAVHPRNVYGSAASCRASVFTWISEVHRGNEELRNKERSEDPIDKKLMQRFGQFYKKTRMFHCKILQKLC
jgi:hypothetical protein